MDYRNLTENDAGFLTRIFSVAEYDLYFAENDTTQEQWKERTAIYEGNSFVVSKDAADVGWIMYRVEGDTCCLDILALLPSERYKRYGKEILSDLLARNAQVRTIKLDVQQRNRAAVRFYETFGFRICGEELQPVKDERIPYYNMILQI